MFLASGTVVKVFTKYVIMRTALFWVVTQRVVVISYRHFGTSYWFYLQDSRMIVWVIEVEIMELLWKHCVFVTVIFLELVVKNCYRM